MNDKYLIDGHKLLWHLDRVVEWQNNPLISPIYIEVSPVSYCDNNCIFCGLDFVKARNKLNTEKYISFIKEAGKSGLKSVMFAGEGEPLLHEELDRLIRETYDSGVDTSLVTNGNKADKELMDNILKYLTWIRFSVDAGSDKVYSKVHGVKSGIFEKVLKNIENCVKIKRAQNLTTTIGVQFLVLNENFKDIECAIKIFSEIGIDYITLKPFSHHPQMERKLEINYSEEKLSEINAICKRYSRDIDIIFRKLSFQKYIKKEKDFKSCYALSFWGHLTAAGEFFTCSVFIGDDRFKAGNINYDNARKILFGSKRERSIQYGIMNLDVEQECRVNCRMARINEFLTRLKNIPEHVNFI